MSLARYHELGDCLAREVASDMVADGESFFEVSSLPAKINAWDEVLLTQRLYSSNLVTLWHNLIYADYGLTLGEWLASLGLASRSVQKQRAFMIGYITAWAAIHREAVNGDTRAASKDTR